ncbi:hypothetical protein [Streptomyces sp. 900105755]
MKTQVADRGHTLTWKQEPRPTLNHAPLAFESTCRNCGATVTGQRWQRPRSRLAERAGPEEGRELVEGVWDGPVEFLRVLLRSGLRHRTDDTARYLLAIADSSPWPGVVRETVRVGTLLRSKGSPQRWLPALETPSNAQR